MPNRIDPVPPQNPVEQRIADVAAESTDERIREARNRIYARFAVLFALPIACVALIPSLAGIYLIDKEIKARCEDGRVNRDGLRETLLDGLGTLGLAYDAESNRVIESGVPIDYYVNHPEELRERRSEITTALYRFPEISCDGTGIF